MRSKPNIMNKLVAFFFLILTTTLYSQQNEIWEIVNFPDSLAPVTVNAQREGVLFVSGDGDPYGGLFRSFDEGQSWEQIEYDSLWFNSPPYHIIYSLDNILFIATSFGIYRSYDDGDTFDKVYSGDYGAMKFRFSPDNHLYTVGWGLMLRSTDLGTSWDTVSYYGWTKFYSDIAFGLNGELFAVGGGYHPLEGGFYRSLDNGATWQNIGITDTFLRSVVVNSNGTIMAGGFDADKVYRSFDNGATWELSGNILADIMETYGNDLLITGGSVNSNKGCWFSEDWGELWVDMEDDILNSKITAISISPSNTLYIRSHWLGATSNQLFRSINPILRNKNNVEDQSVIIYPNPSKSKVKISNNYAKRYNKYILIDQLGKTVQTDNISENIIDVSSLKPGYYILVLISDSESVRIKFEKI